MKRKYRTLLCVMLLSFVLFNGTAKAGYKEKSITRTWNSAVGIKVVSVTFNASGYSYSKSGSVSNMYFNDWAIFPNTLSDRKTWTSSIPYGKRANGSILVGVGINSPWGAVNLWGGQQYFKLDF